MVSGYNEVFTTKGEEPRLVKAIGNSQTLTLYGAVAGLSIMQEA